MSDIPNTPVRLRTANWYEGTSRDNFIHRSWMKRGLPDDAFTGKPWAAPWPWCARAT